MLGAQIALSTSEMRVGPSLGRAARRGLWTEAAARLRRLEEGHQLWKAIEQRLITKEVDEALAVVRDIGPSFSSDYFMFVCCPFECM